MATTHNCALRTLPPSSTRRLSPAVAMPVARACASAFQLVGPRRQRHVARRERGRTTRLRRLCGAGRPGTRLFIAREVAQSRATVRAAGGADRAARCSRISIPHLQLRHREPAVERERDGLEDRSRRTAYPSYRARGAFDQCTAGRAPPGSRTNPRSEGRARATPTAAVPEEEEPVPLDLVELVDGALPARPPVHLEAVEPVWRRAAA